MDLLTYPPPAEKAAPAPELVYRELKDPAEIVALLRLRHRVYFEQERYGAPKPLGLDLTAYDARSQLFGVFAGDQLVAGVRFVFRDEQRAASIVRAVRAVVMDAVPEQRARVLPSEECAELPAQLGVHNEFVDVEIGRLVALRASLPLGMAWEVMIATLAVAHLVRARLYLYSCGVGMARRYARLTKPRWQFEVPDGEGIRADAWRFPKRSVAAVAAIVDSPYLDAVLTYAHELEQHGRVVLQKSVREVRK